MQRIFSGGENVESAPAILFLIRTKLVTVLLSTVNNEIKADDMIISIVKKKGGNYLKRMKHVNGIA